MDWSYKHQGAAGNMLRGNFFLKISLNGAKERKKEGRREIERH